MKQNFYTLKNILVLTAICLATLMFSLEISSVPVILPTLEKILKADLKDMQWIMNIYTIGCTSVLMATGTLADRYGRKRILIITLILFAVSSLICGIAQDISVLIISRLFQGISGGAMLICQIAALSHQFQEGKERSKAFSIWGVILGIGLGFGPIIGGAIIEFLSWQWVFLIHVPIAVLAVILVYGYVDESKDSNTVKLDIWGMITLSISIFGLTYFITQGSDPGFFSPITLSSIIIAVISFILFLWIEKRIPYPMFDFSIFKIRNFSGAIFGSIGMNFSFWPFIIYLPIYFQSYLGYDVVTVGLSLLAYTLPTLVIPPLAEYLSVRYRSGIVIPLGLFVIGLGFILMRYGAMAEHASWLTMLPGSLLAGIGLGLTNTPVTNTTTGSVPASRAGIASGIDMSARLITLSINIALMGFLLVEGISSYLNTAFSGTVNTITLHSAAEKIAAGNFSSLNQEFSELAQLDSFGNIAHNALSHGFEIVLLYGGIGVWILALISFITFNFKSKRQNL
ncbi:EmrB/QacA subfamily drug resistance transporter [Flavobacterium sp. HSC-32F16]|uniref:MFS transporter n=1 Tax=Flavobacterium sp. HSC-32F16 TaxID=2910964 RepID=UPI0020A587B9|nr:MFS transporter [Flavobacterium sp. HSC-32F16]MCP2026816.1 EmrB/QacA subfamily drug resistance transporter [Flavobacterium sp. HSC-32F16]